ncbi:L,D-transpeptidase, partial [Streptomyces sp. TRM76130]|nr:L,D-transpeptidase [Streptomyces sp. TRM76130]
DPRCLTGRVLCVSKGSRTLRWMIDGRTVSTMEVRFGSRGTPTREGVFSVYWKSRNHWSTLYDSAMPYA